MADATIRRVHIFGASGSGTTTLGRALATNWSIPHHDTDDYYWLPTPEPYSEIRPVPERISLMKSIFLRRSDWILSGSVVSWSAQLIPYFDAAIYLSVDNSLRLERIRAREAVRYGSASISPGGHRHNEFSEFMDWNARYEDPDFQGRSRRTHELWAAKLSIPVIRIDSQSAVEKLVNDVNIALSK